MYSLDPYHPFYPSILEQQGGEFTQIAESRFKDASTVQVECLDFSSAKLLGLGMAGVCLEVENTVVKLFYEDFESLKQMVLRLTNPDLSSDLEKAIVTFSDFSSGLCGDVHRPGNDRFMIPRLVKAEFEGLVIANLVKPNIVPKPEALITDIQRGNYGIVRGVSRGQAVNLRSQNRADISAAVRLLEQNGLCIDRGSRCKNVILCPDGSFQFIDVAVSLDQV
jgi:hypothetical protein